ncbi:MAG: hypothetical protein WCP85_19865 [Mariniphaga sp.]
MNFINATLVCSVLSLLCWYVVLFSARIRAALEERYYSWHMQEITLLLFGVTQSLAAYQIGGRWVALAFAITFACLRVVRKLLHKGFVTIPFPPGARILDFESLRDADRSRYSHIPNEIYYWMSDRQRQWNQWRVNALYAENMHENMRRIHGKKARSVGVMILMGVVYLGTSLLILLKW